MNILNLIRDRLTARQTDARSTYWQTVEKIATGNLSERAAEAAAEALLDLLPALGKLPADFDADVELLARLIAFGDADEQVQAAHAASRDAVQRAAALTQQAEAARAEAKRLDAESEAIRRQAENQHAMAKQAASDARDLRRQLAQRGHNTIAARIEREADDRRNADALRQAELNLATIDEEQRSTESYLPTARHPDAVLRQVETLKAKRAAAAKLVEELRAAVPTEVVQ